MTTNLVPNDPIIFECNNCHYNTSRLSQYTRHLVTRKHIILQENIQIVPKIYNCVNCNKMYKHHSSLWNHNKKCISKNDDIIEKKYDNKNNDENKNKQTISPQLNIEKLTAMFIDTVKQNQELQRQSQEFQQKMFEMMKDNIGTTNNTMINSNNKFNLNVFLNETCKDAMNLSDFIDSIKVKFEDIEYTGENGFAAGVSRIFLQELNKLEICKRPIHCSDVKREIFHIKDQNTWEKERKMLVKVIQQITRKNIVLLVDWRLAHPGCMEYRNKMNNKYDKINGECLGPYKDDEELRDYNRIITNVAKATIIDKKPICNL